MKSIGKLFLNNFWFRNLAVLLLLFSMITFVESSKPISSRIFYNLTVSGIIYTWIAFHNRILIDIILQRKRYLLYFIGLLAGLALYTFATFQMGGKAYSTLNILPYIYYAFFNTILGVLFYTSFKYYKSQQQYLKNQLYMIEMEQKYLKSQLSPHFIFNTLNNIYYYSLEESKRTPELILKLSELIRFLNEFNKKPQITLKEELSFLDGYLLFERERLQDRCEINYICEIGKTNRAIEPLIFFPLVENAFKHGTNTIERCFVNIKIKEEANALLVTIENKILKGNIVSTQTGKENVQRRLELFYPDRHSLLVTKDNGIYKVDLKIELKNEYITV